MELTTEQEWQGRAYLGAYRSLVGDRRTWRTFEETVSGIIKAGTLVCQRIAASSAVLGAVKDGGQRVIRMVTGESTQRSRLGAQELVERLQARGIAHLGGGGSAELWAIMDESELRKPYAREMPALMRVRALDGQLVPGYRTLNVIGVTAERQGILYHRLFSSAEAEFTSESLEVQTALESVSRALAPWRSQLVVTWIMDSGFDDVAVWRTIWEQQAHVVCRVKHSERKLRYRTREGTWEAGSIALACAHLERLASAQMHLEIRLPGQPHPKRQTVTAELSTCPVELTYNEQVRRAGEYHERCQSLWLVQVRLLKSDWEPWLLVTDWPVSDAESIVRILQMYRQRWSVEDSFKFTKQLLGWEEVQLLDLEGIRNLVALGWVAAGFLYELGVTLEWEEVQLLARLGGWAQRPDRPPGRITLTRGLRRLLDMLATQAFLDSYRADHGSLPPRLEALLRHLPPPDL
jgi:hypothetical protein